MKMKKFDTIAYLQKGSAVQQQAFRVLQDYQIMEKLGKFQPLLIGTVPIDIAVENSDLDIACTTLDLKGFKEEVSKQFGGFLGFTIKDTFIREEIAVVVDRKSTRLNSSHVKISYAVFCLKKKKENTHYQ